MQREDVVNQYVSLILKLGTYSSVLILLFGFLLLVFFPALKEAKPFSFSELLAGFLNLNPYAFINLGALILNFHSYSEGDCGYHLLLLGKG